MRPRRGTSRGNIADPRRLLPSGGLHRCCNGGTRLDVYLDIELLGCFLAASRRPSTTGGWSRRRACGHPCRACYDIELVGAARPLAFIL